MEVPHEEPGAVTRDVDGSIRNEVNRPTSLLHYM